MPIASGQTNIARLETKIRKQEKTFRRKAIARLLRKTIARLKTKIRKHEKKVRQQTIARLETNIRTQEQIRRLTRKSQEKNPRTTANLVGKEETAQSAKEKISRGLPRGRRLTATQP